jgi:RNA polymerase sigma-70 factor (ECF subfamily)
MRTSLTLSHGERTAEFVGLYSAHSRRVYTYLLTLLPSRGDAEEVFQDVSVVMWEKFDEFERGSNFAAWACKVAQFKARKFQERSVRRVRLFSDAMVELLEAEMQASDESINTEYAALAECFARLSPSDREMIQRRYRAKGEPKRLADELGWPVKKVYGELRRIRRALVACVSQRLALGGEA